MCLGHLVSLLHPKSIPQFLRDPVPQALWGEHLHVRHPGRYPPHEFLAPRRLHPQLHATVRARSELLAGVPLALGDVHGQFRLEQQQDLHGRLAAGDSERPPDEALGMEVRGAGESVAGGLHAAEAREGEGLDLVLGRVPGQDIPIPVVREQVVRV